MRSEESQTRILRDRAFDFLRRQPKAGLLAVGYFLVFLTGVADYVTPPDLSFLIFYLVPVFLVTFFVGGWAGALIAVAGIAVWFLVNVGVLAENTTTMIPFWNVAEKLGFFFLMAYLLSALRTATEQEQKLARVDPLTGAANRRRFQEAFALESARARRYARPFTFVCVDLDNFKAVNDRFGTEAGDRLLRTLAETLQGGVREVDTVARLGGDEFAILLPETGYDAARAAIDNLKDRISAGIEANGWPVTLTLGALTYLSPVHTFDKMIGTADRLMHAGKRSGRHTVAHLVVGAPGEQAAADADGASTPPAGS